MMMMIEKIISDIDEKQDEILSNLDTESVAVYIFLKKEFDKGNILNNLIFQFVFRSFYRLDNAGLSDNLKKRFFKLLAEKQTKLDIILSELYEIPTLKKYNSIQFSFATKLLHTIDNDKPIFDRYVIFLIKKKVTGHNKNEKIQSCIEIYNSLVTLNDELKKNDKIRNVILKFRTKFKVSNEEMSDTKVLDSIMWSLGKLQSNT
jgi:hypothetical protein